MAKRNKPEEPMFSDAEIERMRRLYDSIPDSVHIARLRTKQVEHCLRWRRAIKDGSKVMDDGTVFTVEFMTFLLRQSQKSLLKLRIWRATGKYPSSDN